MACPAQPFEDRSLGHHAIERVAIVDPGQQRPHLRIGAQCLNAHRALRWRWQHDVKRDACPDVRLPQPVESRRRK